MKDDGDMEKVARVEVERCNCLLDTFKAELKEETNELTCGGQSRGNRTIPRLLVIDVKTVRQECERESGFLVCTC